MSRRPSALVPFLGLLVAGCFDPFGGGGWGGGGGGGDSPPPIDYSSSLSGGLTAARGIARNLAAQALDALPAGNPSMALATPVARTGSVSIGVRTTLVRRELPSLDGATFGPDSDPMRAVRASVETRRSVAIDAALGVTPGFRAGTTRILSAELLGSVSLRGDRVRTSSIERPGSDPSFGIGARIGLLAETRTLPSVAFSYQRRSLAVAPFRSDDLATHGSNSLVISMRRMRGVAHGYRLAAGKRIGNVGLSLGWGHDRMSGSGTVFASVTSEQAKTIDHATSRWSVFGGVDLAIDPRLSLGAEIAHTNTSFSNPDGPIVGDGTTWSRRQLSVGARLRP